MTDVPKGRFTFRFAAVCFGLSALFELFSLTDEAILFGAVVGGAGATIYHAVYIALFALLTIGLWEGKRYGYHTLLGTTILYTIDRLQTLFVGDALTTQIQKQLTEAGQMLQAAGAGDMLQAVTPEYIRQMMTMASAVILLCWWGFVWYAYVRRSYFGIRP